MGAALILDSSAMLALINPLDIYCHKVGTLLTTNLHRSRVLHEVSLAECLVRAEEQGNTYSVLAFIESLGIEFADSSGVKGARRVAEIRMKTKLPLPDCYVVDASLMLRLPLVSFDHKLNQSARELGVETLI